MSEVSRAIYDIYLDDYDSLLEEIIIRCMIMAIYLIWAISRGADLD